MIYEPEHPDTRPEDWAAFVKQLPPLLIGRVIGRDVAALPSSFLPLARGVAIASDLFLRKAGYAPGSYRPRGWKRLSRGSFRIHPWPGSYILLVQRYGKFWSIQRVARGQTQTLVFWFGSTPVFAPNYQSAMRISQHCFIRWPISGLRWVTVSPDDLEGAIEFARKRHLTEARATRLTNGGSLQQVA